MSEQALKEETLNIIKEIELFPAITQRTLAAKLGISLGKTNYLLQALIKKGFIEAEKFYRNQHKSKKIRYLITRRGLEEKVSLIRHFLKQKELEYASIKKEWSRLKTENF